MNYRKKAGFYTFGCKLNYSESSGLATGLQDEGFELVDFSDPADFYIINTCSVTENANKKCRQLIRRVRERAPESQVVVTGCYAQLKPKEIAEIPGVSLVLGAGEKFKLVKHLKELEQGAQGLVYRDEIRRVNDFHPTISKGSRTRSFLKVQDGCDYFCSFCTIPLARGRSRSTSVEQVVNLAKKAAEENVREIVLTGVNIGDFGRSEDGKNRGKESFLDLVQALDQVEGIERFRISSIEPNLLSDEIIAFLARSNRFMPHFHIPLQSGSDRLLKSMRRKYDAALYRSRVMRIKELMPHCCIGVDVICGFPGEGEDEFNETLDLIHELPVSYLHVFTYSEREQTQALKLPDVVPMNIRRERSNQLRLLSEKKKRAFYLEHLGAVRPALFEKQEEDGSMFGFTDNYIKVRMPYHEALTNTIRTIKIESVTPDCFADISVLQTQSAHA